VEKQEPTEPLPLAGHSPRCYFPNQRHSSIQYVSFFVFDDFSVSSIGKGNIYGETPFDQVCTGVVLLVHPFLQAEVDFWIDWSKEFELPTSVFLYSLWGLEEGNKAHKGFASKDLQYLLGKLNEVLLTRTFLVGNGVTLADIAGIFFLFLLFKCCPNFLLSLFLLFPFIFPNFF
jgi:hypothetical protein